ncbi:tetratricopeptide repeat protein [Leptolyngbya sp. FACHB-261]|nr:tetratricopeptide repeat protein [Leptolyngbya sp. FACHB-261]
MAQKRRRWLVIGFVLISMVSLLGFSVAPFLPNLFDQSASVASTPQNTPADLQADLKAQERGYELVIQREPDNRTALEGLVRTRAQLGNFQGLVEPLQQLVKLSPQEPGYAVLLAQAQLRLGDQEAAASTYRDVLTRSPGEPDALNGLVGLLLQQNKPEAAVGLLQDTLKVANQQTTPAVPPPPGQAPLQPQPINKADVQWLLGNVYAAQQRYPEALQVYDQILNRDKNDFRPLVGKALVLREQGKAAESQALFDSAVALAPAAAKDQIKQLATPPAAPPATPAPSTTPPAAAPQSPAAMPPAATSPATTP